jgi:hypothetical protein
MCEADLDSSDLTIDIKRSIDDAIDKLDEIGIIQ